MTLKTMQADIEHLVSQYVKSIDEANSDLAATIWSMTEDVSFIHPRSHEHGWEQVKKQFYEECVFHAKVATNSTAKLPLIPRETCRPFHGKVATDSTANLPPHQIIS